MCASGREVYYSAANKWATIVYPDDDKPSVADVCYANLRPEREGSMRGG